MNYKQTVMVLAISLFLFSAVCANDVFAQGRMTINPHIQSGVRRDTNFHKSEENTKTVDTYYVKPGVELGYTTDKTKITLDYWMNRLVYDDQDDIRPGDTAADEYDYTEHQANFRARLAPTDRLAFGLDNRFWKTREAANADRYSNAVERYKYTFNRFNPWAKYRFAHKFGLGLGYTNKTIDYDNDDEEEDSDENRGILTFYYYFNERTFFDLDCQTWHRDYDADTSDYDSHQMMVNISRQFNYLTLAAGIGYHTRAFDNEADVPGGDQGAFAWQISLTGQNPPDERVKYPKSSLSLSLSSNLNDSGTDDTYYTYTRFDAVATYLFFERINGSLIGRYQHSDYETSHREDDRIFFSGALDYLINDLFIVGLEAGLEDRDSNVDGEDFENAYVMFNIKLDYDFGSK
nr:outer membrane beta-barrel protein [uncultured Desulfobacter sp.]